jgi:hypothetical protein
MAFKVLRSSKLNLHIDNVVFYKPAKFQIEIPYIQSHAKNDKFYHLYYTVYNFKTSKSVIFYYFCAAPYISYLELKFCTFVVHMIVYILIFFPDFFKTLQFHFWIFKKQMHVARSKISTCVRVWIIYPKALTYNHNYVWLTYIIE